MKVDLRYEEPATSPVLRAELLRVYKRSHGFSSRGALLTFQNMALALFDQGPTVDQVAVISCQCVFLLFRAHGVWYDRAGKAVNVARVAS